MAEKPKDGGAGKLFGSLREALNAASREEDSRITNPVDVPATIAAANRAGEGGSAMPSDAENKGAPPPLPSAAEAAREARGGTPNIPPVGVDAGAESAPPTTRVVRGKQEPHAAAADDSRTQLVRGRQPIARGDFRQDPVVGWLVIVGGPGIGAFRPIFEGNNTVGRAPSNRVPIDFGDDAISGEEQAYIRYDSADRSFLLVPNMSKTNVVSVNDKRPTAATPLRAMDVIGMGRTQLVFVPFCGPEFDWGELGNVKS